MFIMTLLLEIVVPSFKKRREIPKSDDRRFKTVTKPAVWVQFAVKKNRVDHKNLLHLKYTTSQK